MKEKTINDIIQQKEKVFQGKIWKRYLKDFQGFPTYFGRDACQNLGIYFSMYFRIGFINF